MDIVEFLLSNEEQLKEYFEHVKVNREKTEIRFGWNPTDIAMTFLIKGPLDEEINDFKDKIRAVFNSDTNIDGLNEKIKEFENYSFRIKSPFFKISKEGEPLIHGFSIAIKKQKKERKN